MVLDFSQQKKDFLKRVPVEQLAKVTKSNR